LHVQGQQLVCDCAASNRQQLRHVNISCTPKQTEPYRWKFCRFVHTLTLPASVTIQVNHTFNPSRCSPRSGPRRETVPIINTCREFPLTEDRFCEERALN
ncbi:hypothetical protein BaRGS_00033288, partial [Batillaria attramentaria]